MPKLKRRYGPVRIVHGIKVLARAASAETREGSSLCVARSEQYATIKFLTTKSNLPGLFKKNQLLSYSLSPTYQLNSPRLAPSIPKSIVPKNARGATFKGLK